MDSSHPFANTFFFKRPGARHGYEHDVFMVRELDLDTAVAGARDRVLRDLASLRREGAVTAEVVERGADYAVLRWTFDGSRGVVYLTAWVGMAADRSVLLGMLLHSRHDEELFPNSVAARLEQMRDDVSGVCGSSLKELIENPEHAVRFEE